MSLPTTTEPEAERQPWDRLPDEPLRVYAIFDTYRRIPPNDRSLMKAYRDTTGRSPKYLGRYMTEYCSRFKWVSRAQAWDVHLAIQGRLAQEEAERNRQAEWVKRREMVKDKEWEIGEALMAKALTLLEFPTTRQRLVRETYDDGRPKETIIVEPTNWDARDIEKMGATASKLMRLAAGMPITVAQSQITGADGKGLTITLIDAIMKDAGSFQEADEEGPEEALPGTWRMIAQAVQAGEGGDGRDSQDGGDTDTSGDWEVDADAEDPEVSGP